MSTFRETLARLGELRQKGQTSSEESDQFDCMIWREWPVLVAKFEEMRKALEWAKYYVPVTPAQNPVYRVLEALDKEMES